MKISRKITAVFIAAGIALSGTSVANAQSSLPFGSSSNAGMSDSPSSKDSRYTPEGFLSEYKQLYVDKGYTIVEAPELIAEYARKAQNEREVTYLPNGNGIFSDSFGHILEGYFPKAQRIKHHDHNIRFNRDGTVLSPASEGERVAIDIFSDDTYYYIVSITFTDIYQG